MKKSDKVIEFKTKKDYENNKDRINESPESLRNLLVFCIENNDKFIYAWKFIRNICLKISLPKNFNTVVVAQCTRLLLHAKDILTYAVIKATM